MPLFFLSKYLLNVQQKNKVFWESHWTKNEFAIKDFSKCDLILVKPRILEHLLKSFVIENFIFLYNEWFNRWRRYIQYRKVGGLKPSGYSTRLRNNAHGKILGDLQTKACGRVINNWLVRLSTHKQPWNSCCNLDIGLK